MKDRDIPGLNISNPIYCADDFDCPGNLQCYRCDLKWRECLFTKNSSQCICSPYYGHTLYRASSSSVISPSGDGAGSSYNNDDELYCYGSGNGYFIASLNCLMIILCIVKIIRIVIDIIRLRMAHKLRVNSTTLGHILCCLSLVSFIGWMMVDTLTILQPTLLVQRYPNLKPKQSEYYLIMQIFIVLAGVFFTPCCLSISITWIWIVQNAKYFKPIFKRSNTMHMSSLTSADPANNANNNYNSKRVSGCFSYCCSFQISKTMNDSSKQLLRRCIIAVNIIVLTQSILILYFALAGSMETAGIICVPYYIIVAITFAVGSRHLSKMLIFTEAVRMASTTAYTTKKYRSDSDYNGNDRDNLSDKQKLTSVESQSRTSSIIRIKHVESREIKNTSQERPANFGEQECKTKDVTVQNNGDSSNGNNHNMKKHGSAETDDQYKIMASDSTTNNMESKSTHSPSSIPNRAKEKKRSPLSEAERKSALNMDSPNENLHLLHGMSVLDTNKETAKSKIDSNPESKVSKLLILRIQRTARSVIISLSFFMLFAIISVVFTILSSRNFTPPHLLSPVALIDRLIPISVVFGVSCLESFIHNSMVIPAIASSKSVLRSSNDKAKNGEAQKSSSNQLSQHQPYKKTTSRHLPNTTLTKDSHHRALSLTQKESNFTSREPSRSEADLARTSTKPTDSYIVKDEIVVI